jgi:hypothetical protein
MSRGPDVATQLARAIEASGPAVTVARHEASGWASATFSGARHRLTIEARATTGFDRWLAALPEADFALRGHLVADVTVGSVEKSEGRARVVIEALTVEE